ncbi:MAG: 2-oxoglutarate dehydrogenase complex dihydrolipoyllysine-residue succinyltransferase [Bacteroidota bacterium]
MALEIKIPSPGESITEVELASWFMEDGALITKNQEIGEIESEKATLPLIAEQSGQLKILVQEGETVNVGDVVATIDTSVKVPDTPAVTPEPVITKSSASIDTGTSAALNAVKTTPVARQMMEKEGLSVEDIINGLKKITAANVKQVMVQQISAPIQQHQQEASRETERKKVSQLRKKISERLVAVKNETAMLTTFNEADMSAIMAIRKKHQDKFVEKHGLKLGFMSFFTKAVTEALKLFPSVNSYLEEGEVVSPKFCDIGIAVQTDKGLMVPVIRNAEVMGLAHIEERIADLAARARKARLSIEEMSGGTFTISNGGIYGSMLSTPILNPPQSGILGMHNIVERPVAIQGKVEIRPMMFIALSYDHRVIDGKDSVGFLKTVKEYIEEPSRMLFGSQSPEQFLLEI